jgi:hypothetical protein
MKSPCCCCLRGHGDLEEEGGSGTQLTLEQMMMEEMMEEFHLLQ